MYGRWRFKDLNTIKLHLFSLIHHGNLHDVNNPNWSHYLPNHDDFKLGNHRNFEHHNH